jgi:hypothetical protein
MEGFTLQLNIIKASAWIICHTCEYLSNENRSLQASSSSFYTRNLFNQATKLYKNELLVQLIKIDLPYALNSEAKSKMKFQPKTSIALFFCLAIFFINGPLASAYVATSLAGSTSLVPISARGSFYGPRGLCTAASPCQGDITYYEAGLGACGATNDGTVERIVALPHALMGALSNNNPYCGKTITIHCTSTGKTTTATVMDKCMGCENYAIDLSSSAFQDLEDLPVGRTGATWWFN